MSLSTQIAQTPLRYYRRSYGEDVILKLSQGMQPSHGRSVHGQCVYSRAQEWQ